MKRVNLGSVAVGRALLVAGLGVLVALFSWEAFSEELAVVEVRRNIPLSESDPVYKDFYINSGTDLGLKKNMVVTATRKITVKDASGSTTFGELIVPVGQLKIIAVVGRVAVAREYKLISRDDEAMLDQIGVMIGDKLDLTGSFIDKGKSSVKKTE